MRHLLWLLLLGVQESLSFLAPLKLPATVGKYGHASARSFTMRPLQTPASIQARRNLPLTVEMMSSSLSEFADDAAGSTLTATAAGPASRNDHAKYDWRKVGEHYAAGLHDLRTERAAGWSTHTRMHARKSVAQLRMHARPAAFCNLEMK